MPDQSGRPSPAPATQPASSVHQAPSAPSRSPSAAPAASAAPTPAARAPSLPPPAQGGLIPVRSALRVTVRPSVPAEILSAIVEVDFHSNGDPPPEGSLVPRLPAEYEALRRPVRPVFMHGLALRDHVLLDLGPDAQAHQDFAALDRYLADVPPETWVGWATHALHNAAAWRARQPDGLVPTPPPPAALTLFEAARDCVAAVIRRGTDREGMPDADPDTAARLVTDGAMLSAHDRRMAALLWEAIEPQWRQALPALRQLAEDRSRGPLPVAPVDIFTAVTGLRPVDADQSELADLARAERIAFYPVLHNAGYSSAGTAPDGQACVVFEPRDLPRPAAQPETADDPVALLAAAADPFRWRVLSLLAERGPLYTQDILTLTGLAQSTASRHLREMEQSGLVRVAHEGRRTCYTLDTPRLRALADRLHGLTDGH